MKRTNAILVSHTHWDREWYWSVEESRFRLARMVDAVLDIVEREPGYHSFWFDGQTVALADYLDIRPENRARVERAVRRGRILVGPWYVLGDEFLVGAESHVRNLLRGVRDMRGWGQDNRVGYLPDTFGHIGQMPQILRGFGIDNAVFWRGYRLSTLKQSETLWQGSDGSRVVGVCLVQGYSAAAALGKQELHRRSSLADQRERLDHTLPTIIEKAGSDTILLMNGIDHAMPTRNLPACFAEIEARYPGLRIRHGSLAEFLAVARRVAGRRVGLAGELAFAPRLDGTLSSRGWLKARNRECESLLVHYAEPLATWAWARGAAWPGEFLGRAWSLTMKNHAHDTICGCHADSVAEDAAVRFRRALEIGEGVAREAQESLGDFREFEQDAGTSSAIAVFQPLGWPVERTWECTVDVPEAERRRPVALRRGRVALPVQVLSASRVWRRQWHDHTIPTVQGVTRFRVAVGPTRFGATASEAFEVVLGKAGLPLEAAACVTARRGRTVLRNDFMEAAVHPDGRLDIRNRRTGRSLAGLNRLVIEGDAGDLYAFERRAGEEPRAADAGRLTVLERGPVRVAVLVRTSLRLRRVRVPIALRISLTAGDEHVAVRAEIDNRERDHRIQALFPLDRAMRDVRAHMPFEIVVRDPVAYVEIDGQPACTCRPMQYAVWARGGGHALFIPNRGLYEHTRLEPGRLGLTLLRATGTITRTMATHAAAQGQCPGLQIAEYGVGLVAGADDAALLRRAFELNLPPRAAQVFGPTALPLGSLVRLHSRNWILSAVKRAEDGRGVIVRVFNASGRRTRGRISTALAVSAARLCRLDETDLRPLRVTGGGVSLEAGPREIVTVRLQMKRSKGDPR